MSDILSVSSSKTRNKRTFKKYIEDQMNPTVDRKIQERRTCFIEAAKFWDSTLVGTATLEPWELPDEIIIGKGIESVNLRKELMQDLHIIIKLGIDARKKQIEEKIGEFELGFEPFEYESENDN
jgi:hypothetical protein